jgi:carbon-monoxide dehydrogenase medium subunit
MQLAAFDYVRPTTLDEALRELGTDGARAIAGGQSLMPMMAFRMAAPPKLVDIAALDALRGIAIGPEGIRLGALTRWVDIETHSQLETAHPLLVAAIRHVAHYQIRNRGTVGGSLAHADPASELPGVALVCDAVIHVTGPAGPRAIPASAFFIAPLVTALAPGELITALTLPHWPPGRRWAFEEFARRRGDFAMAGVALHFSLDREGRIDAPRAAGIGIAATPLRLHAAEAALKGQHPATAAEAAGHAAAAECDAGDDIHADAPYRRALLATLVERAVMAAAA